jgi:hypothetical protein
MKKFTEFENQYILMLASRAKRELQKELAEEEEKMKYYNNSESFLDPNIKDYIKALQSICTKAKENKKELEIERAKKGE